MSTHADPTKAYVWLDGDAYRGTAGIARPDDPFADNPVSGSAGEALLAFGGIEAGFELKPDRTVTPKTVWNRRRAPYKVIKSPTTEKVTLRPVDYSPASVLTTLQGGTIAKTATGVYEWQPGDDEEFAILLVLRDESANEAFWSDRVTLTNPPPRTFGKEDLDGFEFELLALEPFVPLTDFNPFQTVKTVTLTGGPFTAGTFTLTFAGQPTTGIAYNATASAVRSALEALSTVGTGNASVSGSAGGPYTVTLEVVGVLSGTGTGLTPSGTVQIS